MEKNNIILLDGAMGTMLQAAGLPRGTAPESWNLSHGEVITQVGRAYVEAGSQVIYANTFGANRHKLGAENVSETVRAGVFAARKAVEGTGCRVALDVGPIGQLLAPLGTLSFDEAYDIFREVVVAGEEAGADLVVFETMSDLLEVKAGVLAARENTRLPVWATMTFEKNARTFLGVTVPAMALTLTGLGVDALGFNCSLGPRELIPMVEELSRWTEKPMILKPNAGLPDPATGQYDLAPEAFAGLLAQAAELGVQYFGGCCGTTPAYISALKEALRGVTCREREKCSRHGVCSATCVKELSGIRVIGERINPTGKKRFQQALREGDMDYILRQGVEQQDAGADILDVNVGLPGIDEGETMKQVVTGLQSVTELPLQIDSSDPEALEAGLRYYNGKAIVNSVNGDEETLRRVLPLCKKYGAAVVGLTMDKNGIPQTAEERVAIARRILDKALSYGLAREDVYMDCLTLTVSAQPEQATETLEAVRRVRKELGLHTVLGVSNISFGLPRREQVTVSFLTQALAMGLDLPIVNPNSRAVMDAVCACRVLSGEDRNCLGYVERFAGVEESVPACGTELSLSQAVAKGLKEETASLTRQALEHMDELRVVNELLIPALDKVGQGYEKQEIFLPQLIQAANAACQGFEVIKARLAGRGAASVSRGKILVATVQGDIHDIGKNIVKVILENYGYTVLDLGKDVPPEKVVEIAIKEDIRLIGLSALMTTTLGSMERTIRALRESGHACKIWVGGAVLTADYAKTLGADFYASDAKESADIAQAVLG